jgi:hypothetical protein
VARQRPVTDQAKHTQYELQKNCRDCGNEHGSQYPEPVGKEKEHGLPSCLSLQPEKCSHRRHTAPHLQLLYGDYQATSAAQLGSSDVDGQAVSVQSRFLVVPIGPKIEPDDCHSGPGIRHLIARLSRPRIDTVADVHP